MSRVPTASPFLLGFDEIERAFERVARSASDGYPPFNIERIAPTAAAPETLRIVLAVAGFTRAELEIVVEDGQLEARDRVYLHRGIAARQFQRVFLLADGMQVAGAELAHGLLAVDLVRPEPQRRGRIIEIAVPDTRTSGAKTLEADRPETMRGLHGTAEHED